MSRVWLAALGAAAVLACGDDDTGGGPSNLFPDVAGTYAVTGEFDGGNQFTGSVTLEQESLESSILSGTASFSIGGISGAELQDASVSLAGVVAFTVENPASNLTWSFTGERAGDVLEGDHTLTIGTDNQTGTWSGER